MQLTDLFDIKFKKHAKYEKPILFLVSKVKHFELNVEQTKGLIKDYLQLIKDYDNLSVCLDLCSFDTVSLKSVWEGMSEVTFYDKDIARSVKQECMIITNEFIISLAKKVLQVHTPVFRFKMVTNLKDGVGFLSEGMENNFSK